MRELSAERLAACARAQVGSTKLGLGLRDGSLITRDYWPVSVTGEVVANVEVPVRIVGVGDDARLVGELSV